MYSEALPIHRTLTSLWRMIEFPKAGALCNLVHCHLSEGEREEREDDRVTGESVSRS